MSDVYDIDVGMSDVGTHCRNVHKFFDMRVILQYKEPKQY